MHNQVCVRVNAWVDEKAAPLIEALNKIEGVTTFESCEEWFPGQIGVLFLYGEPQKTEELFNFCCFLAENIRKLDLCCGFNVSVEWMGSNDQPWGRILVAPDHIQEVSQLIERLAAVSLR